MKPKRESDPTFSFTERRLTLDLDRRSTLWWVNKLPYYDGSIGWLDTYEVQIIPFIANAFSIYLYHQYFESIPKELDEAARIDGAGWFKIYRQVVMPLAGPATATVAIPMLGISGKCYKRT